MIVHTASVPKTQSDAIRIKDATLGAILPDQIRFRLEGSGRLAARTLVPETAAAVRLLSSSAGDAQATL